MTTSRGDPGLKRERGGHPATELVESLGTERRLLEELTAVMHHQRRAGAAGDLASLDEAVFATHRILLTLAEARYRRTTLSGLVRDRPGVPAASDAVQRARAELRAAARRLGEEVQTNRRVLREALAVAQPAGDEPGDGRLEAEVAPPPGTDATETSRAGTYPSCHQPSAR